MALVTGVADKPEPPPTATPPPQPPTEADAARDLRAEATIKNHMLLAMGAGLIPIPVADALALATIQLKLVATLADVYGVKFSEHSGKVLVGSLLGGTASSALAVGTGSFLKTIPVVGQVVGGCALSVYAGATTYAVGEVFRHHFKSGGTLLDFDPEAMKTRFGELFDAGVQRLKGGSVNGAAPAPPTSPSKAPERGES